MTKADADHRFLSFERFRDVDSKEDNVRELALLRFDGDRSRRKRRLFDGDGKETIRIDHRRAAQFVDAFVAQSIRKKRGERVGSSASRQEGIEHRVSPNLHRHEEPAADAQGDRDGADARRVSGKFAANRARIDAHKTRRDRNDEPFRRVDRRGDHKNHPKRKCKDSKPRVNRGASRRVETRRADKRGVAA